MASDKKIDLSDLGAKPIDLTDLGATPIETPELAALPQIEQVSQLEAAGRGAAQGLSLGTSEEIAAGVQVLGALPKTGLDWEALKKVYEEKVLKQREREKLAAEQNPLTYHGAEIAAPFLLPAAGALGAAGKLGKLGGAIAEGTQFLNVPGKVIEGTGVALEALPGASKLAQSFPGIARIAKGATEGAVLGGAYGAGKTEAPITSEQGLEQIKESAQFGGVLGGGLSALGAGAHKAALKGMKYDGAVGDISRGYLSALEGKNLTDFNKVADQAYEYSQMTGNRWLQDEVQRIKNAFNSFEAAGEASGKKANIQDIFKSLETMRTKAENVGDPAAQKTINQLINLFENKAYGLEELVQKQQLVLKQQEIPGQKATPGSREKLQQEIERRQLEMPDYEHSIETKTHPETGQQWERVVSKPLNRTEGGGEQVKGTFKNVDFTDPEDIQKVQGQLELLKNRLQSQADLEGQNITFDIMPDEQNQTMGLVKISRQEPNTLEDLATKWSKSIEGTPEVQPKVENVVEPETMFVKERPGTTPELGMQDVVSLEKKIGEDRLGASLEPAQKKIYGEVDKLITGKAEQISPEYAIPRSQWKNMENAFEKIGINRNEMVDFLAKGPEASPDFMKKVNDQIIKSFETDYSGKVAKENLDRAFSFLEEAGYKDLPQIRQKLEENMRDYLLSQQMTLGGVHPGVASHNPAVSTLSVIKSFGAGGAHRIGLLQNAPLTKTLGSVAPGVLGKELTQQREAATPTENMSRDLSYSDNANLQGVTQTLKSDKNLSYLGEALEKAIQAGDTVKKNALVFAISQNPQARKLLEGQK